MIIAAKSVSIRSLTRYMSLNACLDSGFIMVLIPIIFSCYNNLCIFNSLKVLCIKTLCSKALSIFLIATKFSSPSSSASKSFAATTTPYAPYPIGSISSNLDSIEKRVPQTTYVFEESSYPINSIP